MTTVPVTAAAAELDRQVARLVDAGVPGLAGLTDDDVRAAAAALLPHLPDGPATPSRVPFVLVVAGTRPPGELEEALVPLLRLAGGTRPGVLDRNHGPEGLAPYRPLAEVGPPPAAVYALLDVERGEEFCGVRPQDALPVVLGRGRTPLTVVEGLCLVLLHPPLLEKNRCTMLSGPRRGDRRVPAFWISERAPKLGWCWDGNPHTWLGVGSVGERLAPPVLTTSR